MSEVRPLLIRRVLWATGLALFAGSALIWASAAATSLSLDGNAPSASSPSDGRPPERQVLTDTDIQVLAAADLRRPIFDVQVTEKGAPQPVFPWKLVGAIEDANGVSGILRNARGETKMIEQGDAFDEAGKTVSVLEVRADGAVLHCDGQDLQLVMERQP